MYIQWFSAWKKCSMLFILKVNKMIAMLPSFVCVLCSGLYWGWHHTLFLRSLLILGTSPKSFSFLRPSLAILKCNKPETEQIHIQCSYRSNDHQMPENFLNMYLSFLCHFTGSAFSSFNSSHMRHPTFSFSWETWCHALCNVKFNYPAHFHALGFRELAWCGKYFCPRLPWASFCSRWSNQWGGWS